ncbi:MAG: ester cyclase [Deltaproteobacteria bacterium]|nr:ester cyclase [Deltaproteobacteria bacterium]
MTTTTHAPLTRTDARALVAPFYDALNRPTTKDVAALVNRCASPEWRSFSAEGVSKGREEFIKQLGGFGKALPDLTWTVQEVLVDGDRIVVRSDVTGTPAADFMGVPHGGRSFRMMAIDIHTVKDGLLVTAFHVEDWAGALRQLAGK